MFSAALFYCTAHMGDPDFATPLGKTAGENSAGGSGQQQQTTTEEGGAPPGGGQNEDEAEEAEMGEGTTEGADGAGTGEAMGEMEGTSVSAAAPGMDTWGEEETEELDVGTAGDGVCLYARHCGCVLLGFRFV